MRRIAFIPDRLLVKETSMEALLDAMRLEGLFGKPWFFVGDRIVRMRLVERRQIDPWDVWILEDHEVPVAFPSEPAAP